MYEVEIEHDKIDGCSPRFLLIESAHISVHNILIILTKRYTNIVLTYLDVYNLQTC